MPQHPAALVCCGAKKLSPISVEMGSAGSGRCNRSQRRDPMTEQFQVSRRTLLAGAAIAGAMAPIAGAASAQAQTQRAPAKAAASVDVASLPRRKVELV